MRLTLKQIGCNMTELKLNRNLILFSYSTPVAYEDIPTGNCWHTDKFFSRTTTRHINQWLGGRESAKVSQSLLEDVVKYSIA